VLRTNGMVLYILNDCKCIEIFFLDLTLLFIYYRDIKFPITHLFATYLQMLLFYGYIKHYLSIPRGRRDRMVMASGWESEGPGIEPR